MRYVTTTIIDAYTRRPMGYMEFEDKSYVVWPPDVRVVSNAKGRGVILGASVVGGNESEAWNFLAYHMVRLRKDVGRFYA